jgi:hypothetical protein
MLTDQHRLLIAAHVDGALSPERQQAVERLLERSAEARELLGRLQTDSRRVQNLRRRTLPNDFAAGVLSRLPADDGKIVVKMVPARPDSMRLMLTRILAAAAALFICVGVGLYWAFTAGPQATQTPPEIAERPAAPTVPAEPPRVERAQPGDAGPPPVVEQRADITSTPPPTSQEIKPPVLSAPAPPPVLTAPARTPVRLEEVVPSRLSLPISLRSLVNAEAYYRLREELTKDTSHRVEIFCREPWRLADRLTSNCRDLGTKLVIDSTAQQAQKQLRRQPYLLFSDSFTADEWAVFFHNLGYTDRRAEEKRSGDGIFDQLVIMPLAPATDQKELSALIGTDVLAPVSRPAGDDGKSKPKPVVRQALLVPYVPQRVAPLGTKEIKQYLDARQERREGQVAVILVVKPL